MCQAARPRAVVHRVTYDEWCNYLHHTCDVILLCSSFLLLQVQKWVATTYKKAGSEIILSVWHPEKASCHFLWENLQNSMTDVWMCVLAVLDLGHLLLFMLILCDSALPFYSPFSRISKQHTHINHYDVEKAHVRKWKDSSLDLFCCLLTDHTYNTRWLENLSI